MAIRDDNFQITPYLFGNLVDLMDSGLGDPTSLINHIREGSVQPMPTTIGMPEPLQTVDNSEFLSFQDLVRQGLNPIEATYLAGNAAASMAVQDIQAKDTSKILADKNLALEFAATSFWDGREGLGATPDTNDAYVKQLAKQYNVKVPDLVDKLTYRFSPDELADLSQPAPLIDRTPVVNPAASLGDMSNLLQDAGVYPTGMDSPGPSTTGALNDHAMLTPGATGMQGIAPGDPGWGTDRDQQLAVKDFTPFDIRRAGVNEGEQEKVEQEDSPMERLYNENLKIKELIIRGLSPANRKRVMDGDLLLRNLPEGEYPSVDIILEALGMEATSENIESIQPRIRDIERYIAQWESPQRGVWTNGSYDRPPLGEELLPKAGRLAAWMASQDILKYQYLSGDKSIDQVNEELTYLLGSEDVIGSEYEHITPSQILYGIGKDNFENEYGPNNPRFDSWVGEKLGIKRPPDLITPTEYDVNHQDYPEKLSYIKPEQLILGESQYKDENYTLYIDYKTRNIYAMRDSDKTIIEMKPTPVEDGRYDQYSFGDAMEAWFMRDPKTGALHSTVPTEVAPTIGQDEIQQPERFYSPQSKTLPIQEQWEMLRAEQMGGNVSHNDPMWQARMHGFRPASGEWLLASVRDPSTGKVGYPHSFTDYVTGESKMTEENRAESFQRLIRASAEAHLDNKERYTSENDFVQDAINKGVFGFGGKQLEHPLYNKEATILMIMAGMGVGEGHGAQTMYNQISKEWDLYSSQMELQNKTDAGFVDDFSKKYNLVD